MSKIHVAIIGAVAGVLLLAGCSPATSDPQKTVEQTTPQQEPAEQEPAADDYVMPDECMVLALQPGVSIDGPSVAQCAVVVLDGYGSGRQSIEGDELEGDVSFTYADDDYSYAGTVTADGDTFDITYTGRQTWIERGDGAVRVDAGSDTMNPADATRAELWEIIANPSISAALINTGGMWPVGEPQTITLGDGSTVNAYPVASPAPITAGDVQAQDLTIWFTEQAVPVAIEADVAYRGLDSNFRTTFFDLGSPVTIDPVG
ncbi:hypothetical protein FM104_09460 [Microbacterium esteraromaticum]|uniref:LppX_LprAFG lipoprotein n=1 Tax=Microbacterium esteraromaticum TaxID=57043 RepID=A0A1R4JZ54_9MICO|nr:hypothetical protein [Microbacterium esteraromaticum]SJN37075.1 hypothetical protein FM104_09460 [Microbacterium esteraromaticum]